MRPPSDVSFFADDMVRRLARWLRTIGCDVRYEADVSDGELLQIAQEEGRIVLTRDHSLAKSGPGVDIVLLEEENPWLQFREVANRFDLNTESGLFSRCPLCNGTLQSIDKEKARKEIPPRTYAAVEAFFRCSDCAKLYWEGSHTKRMRRSLSELR